MKEEGTQFYEDKGTLDLSGIEIDDTAHTVYIETPEDWKCERKGCNEDFKHEHTTYASLSPLS